MPRIEVKYSFSLFNPTQTMKQHMKDKHRTSTNKSTKLCESHIVKLDEINNNPKYNSYPKKLHRITPSGIRRFLLWCLMVCFDIGFILWVVTFYSWNSYCIASNYCNIQIDLIRRHCILVLYSLSQNMVFFSLRVFFTRSRRLRLIKILINVFDRYQTIYYYPSNHFSYVVCGTKYYYIKS